jgi:hypothetical protein
MRPLPSSPQFIPTIAQFDILKSSRMKRYQKSKRDEVPKSLPDIFASTRLFYGYDARLSIKPK